MCPARRPNESRLRCDRTETDGLWTADAVGRQTRVLVRWQADIRMITVTHYGVYNTEPMQCLVYTDADAKNISVAALLHPLLSNPLASR